MSTNLSMTAPGGAATSAAGSGPRASLATRTLILAYGLAVYALFFGTFLYLVGFLIGFGVPKGVDDGPVGPVGQAILVNSLLVLAFGVQHAIMAHPWFKERWTRVIPPAAERSTFVLCASAILIAMFWQWRPIPGVVWEVTHPVAQGVLYGIFALGVGIVLFSTFLIEHFELFGLRQTVLQFLGRPIDSPRFVERALYKVVRHPLMLGFFLAAWATPHMSWGHLLLASLLTGYIFVGTLIEERTLVGLHGETYLDYRRRVRGLVPLPRRAA